MSVCWHMKIFRENLESQKKSIIWYKQYLIINNFQHSMGGHGALICYLKNPGLYKSASAFAPICNPTECPWGQKAFQGYLGNDKSTWEVNWSDICEWLDIFTKSNLTLWIWWYWKTLTLWPNSSQLCDEISSSEDRSIISDFTKCRLKYYLWGCSMWKKNVGHLLYWISRVQSNEYI